MCYCNLRRVLIDVFLIRFHCRMPKIQHIIEDAIVEEVFATPQNRKYLDYHGDLEITSSPDDVDTDMAVRVDNAPLMLEPLLASYGFKPLQNVDAGYTIDGFTFVRRQNKHCQILSLNWQHPTENRDGIFCPLKDLSVKKMPTHPLAYLRGTPVGADAS